MKAVFDIKRNSSSHPSFTQSYLITNRLGALDVALTCIDDWVVFRETTRDGGRGTYVGIARVTAVMRNLGVAGFFSATISDYLAFTRPVPLKNQGRYAEQELRAIPRSIQIGQALHGRSIRGLGDEDFEAILRAGFGEDTAASGMTGHRPGFDEPIAAPFDGPRRIEQVLLDRPFREPIFRKQVCGLYDYTCAITGLRFGDGVGGFEVEAAHIRSVKNRGPDVVYNGICLCRSIHWLFDANVISIDTQLRLMVIEALIPPGSAHFLPAPGTSIRLPKNERLWPHAEFLNHHRDAFEGKRRSLYG